LALYINRKKTMPSLGKLGLKTISNIWIMKLSGRMRTFLSLSLILLGQYITKYAVAWMNAFSMNI
jgi:hypothetical protein